MKKLIVALTIASTIGTAQALPLLRNTHSHQPSTYQQGYHRGYHKGKSDAYNNVARTVFFVGVATIAGVMIYQAGKQSRWGVNENGVTYKF